MLRLNPCSLVHGSSSPEFGKNSFLYMKMANLRKVNANTAMKSVLPQRLLEQTTFIGISRNV
jgi:hypothetical protein